MSVYRSASNSSTHESGEGVPGRQTGGLLLVHAHPDDESVTTGGTIAYYRRRGVPVTVVTCTLGEEGRVIGERYAQLVSSTADQLGGYRIAELTRALAALDAGEPWFLGGPGRWRDTGVVGTATGPGLPDPLHPRAFASAGDEAVHALVRVLLAIRPQVVIGYDPHGGYGHPDHIRAHQITMAAVDAAAELGWATPKLYWAVTDATVLHRHLQSLSHRSAELPPGWRLPVASELASAPSSSVTTTIDVSEVMPAKLAALRSHSTQISVSPTGREFALSNKVAQPILPEEHFILVRGRLDAGCQGRHERDLLAGLSASTK